MGADAWRLWHTPRRNPMGGGKLLCGQCQPLPDHAIERGLDGPTLKAMRTWLLRVTSVLNAACGGLWMNDRRARAFDDDPECVFCHAGFGTPHHV
eukprot:5153073-Amphidinium_carterae.1